MKIQLDFDTPNGMTTKSTTARRTTSRPPKKAQTVCSFCYQSGFHQSAAQCLYALEGAVQTEDRVVTQR